jgi:ABC-2 type transport system permease protein
VSAPSTAAGGLSPAPGAAPRARILATQALAEVRMILRNGEQLLLTLVIPLVLLVVLSKLPPDVVGHDPAIDAVAPGVLALAVISTAFTGQAIATGFERRYGVLRLLGSTPLGRSGLLVAKTAAVLVVETVQVLLIALVAHLLGWAPVGSWAAAVLLLVLGTAAFSALGLLLAGTLRAEATLAAANGIYLLLLAVGGVVIPADRLPGPLAGLVSLLPSAALGQGLRDVLLHGLGFPLAAAAVLVVWAGVAGVLTARTFRWS